MSDRDCWVRDGWTSDFPQRLPAHWWAFGLRGLFAVLFGVVAIVWPGITLAILVGWFAAYMVIDGAFAAVAAVRAMREHSSFAPLLLEVIADWAAAAIALVWPGLTLLALLYLAAAWAVISGFFLTIGAARLHQHLDGRWLLILSGILSVVWGVLLFVWPIAGLLVLTWWLGAYAILFGIMLIATAFRLRHHMA